ncbi:hypothetical protein V2G26_007480 [Clonostachys chloroleuca]
MSGSRRGKLLWKFADLMEANGAELAGLESLAMGAFPILGQAVVIKNAADVFRYYAGWVDKLSGESFLPEDGLMKIVQYELIGFSVGNTVILKLSEKSSLGFLGIAKLIPTAGFPSGVVQFLCGAAETGKAPALHPYIRKITFTGSGSPGRYDEQEFRNILSYIDSGKQNAELIVGGASKDYKGFWIEPTVFLESSDDAAIYKEEIFGPVLILKIFTDEDQVIGWANDLDYGLAVELN